MSESIQTKLAEALKGYFRHEEYSDKVLHIIEMEVDIELQKNLDETNNEDQEMSADEDDSKENRNDGSEANDDSAANDGNAANDGQNSASPTQRKLDEEEHEANENDKTSIKNDNSLTAQTEVGDRILQPYLAIPVHSLLLSIHSRYFKALTSDSGMKESNSKSIVVKVESGEGDFLLLLIHSIYNQDILKGLGVAELFKILKLADRFLCDLLIECILEILKTLDIKTVEQCNEILAQVERFKSLVSLIEAFNSLTELCGRFLATFFHSMECYFKKQEEFKMVSFDSLLVLLSSNHSFLWHENTVIHFILVWLAADENRQTECNIESLLNKVRFDFTTGGYFIDVISAGHAILSKWQGFTKWCMNVSLFHSVSSNEIALRGMSCRYQNRSLKNTASEAHSYMLKFENENFHDVKFTKFSLVDNIELIYQGYILTPFIIFTRNKVDSSIYNLGLYLSFDGSLYKKEIERFYLKFAIAFGVFPGSITYKPCTLLDACINNHFIKYHFRRFDVEFKQTNLTTKRIGTVDEELYQKFKDEGMNASITFGGPLSELNDWSEEVNSWPTNFRVLRDVRFKEINRKSTTTYGLNDYYPNMWSSAEKVRNGKYY